MSYFFSIIPVSQYPPVQFSNRSSYISNYSTFLILFFSFGELSYNPLLTNFKPILSTVKEPLPPLKEFCFLKAQGDKYIKHAFC